MPQGGGALTLGYIENKRVNADLNALINEANKNEKAQIAKYFHLSPNLIVTDYLRFVLICKDEKDKIIIAKSVRLCSLNDLSNLMQPKTQKSPSTQAFLQDKEKELCELFTLFFSATPRPINTALEFASSLALRSRMLKDSLQDFESHTQISQLYRDFKEVLYKDLDFTTFCDSFAQTLTYALFLAKLNDEKNEVIDLYNAKKFIPDSFPLIRAMSKFLDVLAELSTLKWLVGEILNIINHIDIEAIIKDLNKISEKDLWGDYVHKDPYLHFYETFLSQYDPKLRELRGVYYTPMPVVSFIINAIDEVLKKDFALQGLKSALDNENITLLDFATGTGTFLLEAFRKVLETLPKSYANTDKIKSLISRFYGFEFLIAPYTIAHLKLSQTLKEERGIELEHKERFNIYLTNTIYNKSDSDEINEKRNIISYDFYELTQEFINAQKIKKQHILIIAGNPPYSGASANKGLFEDEVRITYGLEPSKAHLSQNEKEYIDFYLNNTSNTQYKSTFKAIFERKKLQNEKTTKWLLDDYVKFIRFAQSKIEAQDSGIIAIISNNSFLDNPTFRGMRWHLLNSFDKIYILNLHGNARKKESCPDGSKDDNVFDIMQGVCITVFVKNASLRINETKQENKSAVIANTVKQPTSHCHSEQSEESTNSKDDSTSSGGYFANAQYDREQVGYDKNNKNKDNMGLCVSRQTGVVGDEEFNTAFISDKIIDLNLYRRGGEQICPLYLNPNFKENFTPEFRKFIDAKYKEHFSPEVILGYIYAILHHKDYKEKYLDFLKIDFPKIPFVKSKEKFLALSKLGLKLINVHLMRENERERESDEQSRAKCSKTEQNARLMAICDNNEYFGGFQSDGRRQHRSWANLSALSQNLGLVCDRGCKLQEIDNIFIAQNIIDLHLVGSGSYIFPLFVRI